MSDLNETVLSVSKAGEILDYLESGQPNESAEEARTRERGAPCGGVALYCETSRWPSSS